MNFNHRLEVLRLVPEMVGAEIDAAEAVYERLLTARSICTSIFGVEPAADSAVLGAVLTELGSSVRSIVSEALAETQVPKS